MELTFSLRLLCLVIGALYRYMEGTVKLQDLMDTLAPPVHSNIGIPQQNNCYGAVREPLLQGKKELILASWQLCFYNFQLLLLILSLCI